jgi:hypothetical protein
MAKRYRKQPLVVEAMQWDGSQKGADQINEWANSVILTPGEADWPDRMLWVAANQAFVPITPNEWVIKDSAGFYPCQPDIFKDTYEEVIG